jgi:hypothetical protein
MPSKSKILRVSIYDMDGVVVCSLHRYRTITDPEKGTRIDLDYWRENEHRAYEDQPGPLWEQYKTDLLDPSCYVIIATAREMREPDFKFLADKLGAPDYLISRPHGDSTSGAILKISGLVKFFNLIPFKNAKFTVYEDNGPQLLKISDRFNIRGVYVPSKQGF